MNDQLARPSVHTLDATTRGRYLIRQAIAGEPAPWLIGFHGYGENAESHLEALEGIPGIAHWHLASVQALHRFYNRRTGAVVASWMTSQDRECAIEDNVAYVRRIVSTLRTSTHPDAPLVFAGFSQGAAMAYRASIRAEASCAGLLVLGGDIPPDLQTDPALRFPPILLGSGRHDHWYTESKREADIAFFRSRAISADTVIFDGGHEWHADFYMSAGHFLERIRQRYIQTLSASS
jgi:predicted esterase